MKWYFLLISLGSSIAVFSQLDNDAIRDLKRGNISNDTSFIYSLPFEPGRKFFLVQGWESKYSHKDELSLDFKMKPGTRIHAVRQGIVTAVKEDSDKGGVKEEYLNEGNHIVILHNDGSSTGYWHLQKDGALVQMGDTVVQGQWIGLSGNTGYIAFPHLHLYVYKTVAGFTTIPTRFFTRKGIQYLRPGRFYKAVPGQ